jgi:phage gp46-like protein
MPTSSSAQFFLPAVITAPIGRDAQALAARARAVSDVRIYQTDDGGEIDFEAGQPVLDDGLESFVYLSLFGGNEDDPGVADSTLQWWGNFSEQDATRRYRSQTQHLLRSIPATPFNRRRIEDAVKSDLAALETLGLAKGVEATVRIVRANWIDIDIQIELASGETSAFNVGAPWGVRAA